MRLSPRHACAVASALVAVGLGGSADASPAPSCGTADSAAFAVGSEIHDGPARYTAGGAPGHWSVELTNTSSRVCRDVHPVLVLLDERRSLRPEQIRMGFREPADPAGRWRPVRFSETDADENVGVFDAGFRGLTLAPGETGTLDVRLAFTAGTAPDRVVVRAALVQRRGDDGEWVGESPAYRFDVGVGAGRPPRRDGVPPQDAGAGVGPGAGKEPGAAAPAPGGDGAVPERADGSAAGAAGAELAATGPRALARLGLAAGGLVLAGTVLVLAARRVRP
ncbi:hypothetical protein [Streptomyces sp. NPDC060194]|uniref:hypothetical protein n=1 Tax=Streptomyces sp. NPDC060194 TaxID=3347069 RepID=UPI00365EF9FC